MCDAEKKGESGRKMSENKDCWFRNVLFKIYRTLCCASIFLGEKCCRAQQEEGISESEFSILQLHAHYSFILFFSFVRFIPSFLLSISECFWLCLWTFFMLMPVCVYYFLYCVPSYYILFSYWGGQRRAHFFFLYIAPSEFHFVSCVALSSDFIGMKLNERTNEWIRRRQTWKQKNRKKKIKTWSLMRFREVWA